ncbi:MAG: transporter substrate-binding domain-containing protein [Peptostreptococcaceae bacterium]|jgi:polar amino acid transport system substrate-binding protein|nr:transporter substrate-binding domain-containing protein [Peptostreptococcaceae bacterium]
MKNKKYFLFLFFISFLSLAFYSYSENVDNKKIKISYAKDLYPYHFTNDFGKPDGILNDYWKLWAKKVNVDIEFIEGSWEESLLNVKNKKADIHAGCFYTKERDSYLDYANRLKESRTFIFYDKSLNIESIKDLKAFKLGVIKGDYAQSYAQNILEEVSLKAYENYDDLMVGINNGEIKVFIMEDLTGMYFLNKYNLAPDYKYNNKDILYSNPYYAAVKEGDSDLLKLVKSGMALITEEEKIQIERKWLTYKSKNDDNLIISCPRDYAPMSFIDEKGNPKGFLIDFWNLWSFKTGYDVEFYITDFENSLEALKDRRVDIQAGLIEDENKVQFLDFSNKIYEVKTKIFYNPNLAGVDTIEDLMGKKIGTVRGSYQENYISKNYSYLDVLSFDSTKSMLDSGFNNLIDAFIEESVAVKVKTVQKEGKVYFRELKEPTLINELKAGVLKGRYELLDKINEGINKISVEEFRELESEWILDEKDRIYNKENEIYLNQEEEEWLKNNNMIKLGSGFDMPPFEFIDVNDQFTGIGMDFVNHAVNKLNLNLKIVKGSWPDIYESIVNKELDLAPVMKKTKEREAYFEFTKSLITVRNLAITGKGLGDVRTKDDLEGLTVAIEDDYYKEDYLRSLDKVKILEVDNILSALLAVSVGKADVYIGNEESVLYHIRKNSIPNLKVNEYEDLEDFDIRIGFRKDYAILRDIFDKVLDAMSEDEKMDIISKYIETKNIEEEFLTKEEKDYLLNTKTIRLGIDRNWPPFEFVNLNNNYDGVGADYIRKIKEDLKLNLEIIKDRQWNEIIEMAKKGEVDILPAVVKTPGRSEFLNFTKPYLKTPVVIATRDDVSIIAEMKDLKNLRIVVIKDYFIDEYLKRDYPDFNYIYVKDIDEALKMIATKQADAFLGNILAINYSIKKNDLNNIKVSGFTDYNFELAIGVRKDNQILLEILNKSLENISTAEKEAIKNYWLNTLPQDTVNWDKIGKYIVLLVLFIGFVFMIIILWNKRLKEEIEERKQMEKELVKAKERADIGSRTKSEFLANMSHEIRTPMNAVIGMTHLLSNTNLNQKQRDYLKKINQSAYTLLGIINDILDFSKIEVGKLEIEKIKFNIEDVLENISNIIGVKAKDKNIELIIDKDRYLPTNLIGDPLRIGQVILNIANNAVKFTKKGEIIIKVYVKEKYEDKIMIGILISDTGIGMNKEQANRIFNPFTQSDTSTTRKYGGTGLGLSITKKLVELMGGNIKLETHLGKGSKFEIILELEYVKNSESIYKYNNKGLEELKVLVVDDNFTTLEVLKSYIEDFGMDVMLVMSGEEGLIEVEKNDYDLILLDWKLKGMNGLETAKILKQRNVESKIAIITSFGKESIIKESEKLNLDGFILKPINQSTLFNFMKRILFEQDDSSIEILASRDNSKFLTGKNILLVEDNKINQEVAKEILENTGANVFVKENGKEAYEELLVNKNYDVVLMDIQMPIMDGYESTREIRKENDLKEIPIIAMTADVMKGVEEKCKEAGMNDYISKPIDVEEVFLKLKEWLKINIKSDMVIENKSRYSMDFKNLDYESSLKRFGGNKGFYIKLLKDFAREYQEFDSYVKNKIDDEIDQDFIRYVHSLKGVLGTIGAKELYKTASDVEETLKRNSKEDFNQIIETLSLQMKDLIEEIKLNAKENKVNNLKKNKISNKDLLIKIHELREYLTKRRPKQTIEIIKELNSFEMDEDTSYYFETLELYAEKYKFKGALKEVEKIINHLEKKGV